MRLPRKFLRSAVFVGMLAGGLFQPSAPAADLTDEQLVRAIEHAGSVTDEEVRKSIEAGVEYLLKNRDGNGWTGAKGSSAYRTGGETAIALYALLQVGESLEDKRLTAHSKELAPIIAQMATLKVQDTYTMSLLAAAFSRIKAPTPEVRAQMERMRMFFVASLDPTGGYSYRPWNAAVRERTTAALGWADALTQYKRAQANKDDAAITRAEAVLNDAEANYLRADATVRVKGGELTGDISNGQYGTLGAWALADAGMEFPLQFWSDTDRFWRRVQLRTGSWPYGVQTTSGRPAMCYAGLASLFITQEYLDLDVHLEPRPDPNIARALAWVNFNFDPKGDLGNVDYYYWYGVERVGLAGGMKFMKQANWYKVGAREIMNKQEADGSWVYKFTPAYDESPVVGTAYALLFLARGRNAVLFNKLEYNGPWNARPRDDANITEWLSKKFEKPLNWQTVNLKVPPEELMDAPVLMITGSKALTLTPAEIEKLRAYINSGGTIFSIADGGKEEFTESIKKIASKVVEEKFKPKYEFRELPPEHVLFSKKNELWAPIDNPPKILGMSNGVREIWIHSTVDMGGTWQGKKTAAQTDYDFAANLYRYVSGKLPLRTKLQTLAVPAGNQEMVRNVTIARLDHTGNWDPEPGAWPRFAGIMRAAARTKVTLRNVPIAKLDAKATPIAHMTGTTSFSARDADVAALKKFLADGGTLLIDAAGNSADFRASVKAMLARVLAEGPTLEEIPLSSKIYNGTIPDSYRITNVDYRLSYRQNVANINKPQLKGAKLNGRYAVIMSDEDMTSGLLGTNTWGILGYAPDSAQVLLLDLILYSNDPKAGKDGETAAP